VVVATVLGVPALMLSYALKCDDFMASINRQRWSLPIDRLDSTDMVTMLLDLHAERSHHVAELEGETARLQTELLDAFAAVRAS
jgi:polysaccharide pyruvyl transferase WcaK-like protein